MGRARAVLAIAGTVLGVSACGTVLGLETYEIVPTPPDAGADLGADGCWDPTGASGRGCYRCEAGAHEQLINACTTARCVPFDNAARIPGFDGAAPALPDVVVDDVGEAAVSDGAADTGPMPVLCSSLPGPVYVFGSTAMEGVLPQLGEQVGPTRTIVYKADSSCRGIDAILTGDSKLTGKAVAYGATKIDCLIDGAVLADIGISDVAPDKCPGIGSTTSITDLPGPIQVFMFAVPKASTQRSISAEAAFRVFGFGAAAGITPWINDALLLRRHILSGTQITISAFIGLPTDRWAGVRVQGSSELGSRCAAALPAENTLCITSADQRDARFRDVLSNVAYQHHGQTCAYFPDSDEKAVDKLNVRDGHYALWAPIHFYVRGSGPIGNDAVREVMNALTGAKAPADYDTYFQRLKGAGLVPRCAMRVTREFDNGPLKTFSPDIPCGCAFENAFPGTAVECTPCSASAPCGKGTCRYGFCEAR